MILPKNHNALPPTSLTKHLIGGLEPSITGGEVVRDAMQVRSQLIPNKKGAKDLVKQVSATRVKGRRR